MQSPNQRAEFQFLEYLFRSCQVQVGGVCLFQVEGNGNVRADLSQVPAHVGGLTS